MISALDRMRARWAVPTRFTLEVTAFQAGDPRYQGVLPDGQVYPGGQSIAALCQQFGGQESGILKGLDGGVYEFSLAPWAQDDPTTTLLRISHVCTPLYPLHIDPALRPARPPQPVTNTSTCTTQATPPMAWTASAFKYGDDHPNGGAPTPSTPATQAIPSATSRFLTSNHEGGHQIVIASTLDEQATTLAEILARPDVQQRQIACPLCGAFMTLKVDVFQKVTRLFVPSETPLTPQTMHLYLSVLHPATLPITQEQQVSASPFVGYRVWRFSPVSVSAQPVAIYDELDVSLCQRSHEHMLKLQVCQSTTEALTADQLLTLPVAQQQDFRCALCDVTVHTAESFFKAIQGFAQQGNPRLSVQMLHPDNQPQTEQAAAADRIPTVTYDPATAYELTPISVEDYFVFIVRPRSTESY